MAWLLWTSVRMDVRVKLISHAFRPANVLTLCTPLLIVLNGFSPYLGLKTENSFTMFSNIQTEGDRWNHLIMPKFLRVFPLQDDLVTIVKSSNSNWQSAAERGVSYVYWDFISKMNDAPPDMSIAYQYRGKIYDVPRVGDDATLRKPVNPILKKLLWLRRVLPKEDNVCIH